MYSGRIRNITLDLDMKQANTKKNLCCEQLKKDVNDSLNPMGYNEKIREYSIRDFESTASMLIKFCYHCSTKLPKSLRDEWFNTLQSEHNIKATILTPLNELPKEFHSDEWWKKRGL